jgi:uncharacterized protein YkwD
MVRMGRVRTKLLWCLSAAVAVLAVACAPPPTPAAPVAPPPAPPTSLSPRPSTTLPTTDISAPRVTSLTATLSASTAPTTVTATATATDPQGGPITFVWLVNGVEVEATSLSGSTSTVTAAVDRPGPVNVMVQARSGFRFDLVTGSALRTLDVTGWNPAVIAAREQRIAADILARHNLERAARGIGPLTANAALASEARAWAAANASLPLTHDLVWLGAASGRGENMHMNFGYSPELSTGAIAHVAWMRSTGHRLTLLDPGLTVAGVGVVCDPDSQEVWITVRFTGSSHTKPAQPEAPITAGPDDYPGDTTSCLADG